MEQKESLEILDGCLKQIESMSPEDIEAHEKEKDININWLMKEAENNKIKRILKAIIHEFGLYVQTGNFLISFDLFFYPLCLDFYFVLYICNKRLFGLDFYKRSKRGIPLTVKLLEKSISFYKGKSNTNV